MTQKKNKFRLDEELVKRGLADSKEKAAAMVMAGDVLLEGQVVYKAGTMVRESHRLALKEKFPYASRGALKIEKAFNEFQIEISGKDALDIGISTGGFSDYMLQHNAQRVTGVDVNIQQVDFQLRQDERLKLIEANAREPGNLTIDKIGFQPDIITIDVSFISVTRILPSLSQFPGAKIICLIKPQFEAKKQDVGKGGVIREAGQQAKILLDLKERISKLGYGVTGVTPAGVKGRKGNQEYFFLLEYGKNVSINDTIITHATEL